MHRAALLLAAVLPLAGCAGGGPAPDRPDVTGEWELVEGTAPARRSPVPRSAAPPWASTADSRAATSFCNPYSATYRLDGDVLVSTGSAAPRWAASPR